jgi:acetyl-CoA acetyltransferase
MGITSENVAERYGVTRYAQDDMAARSHKHAAHARAQGYFDSEIVPTKAVTVVR